MAYRVLEANLTDDRSEILRFWAEGFPERPAGRYDWTYRGGFYGPATCWLIREEPDDRLVGTAAVYPRRFLVRGEPLTAGSAVDFGVRRDHRLVMAALRLQRAIVGSCAPGGPDFLYGFSNRNAEAVQARAGFRAIGPLRGMVRILRWNFLLQRRLKSRRLADALSVLPNALWLAAGPRRGSGLPPHEEVVLDRFDAAFGRVLREGVQPFSVVGERAPDYLNWRFSDCPLKSYRIFALREGSGTIVAYVVFREETGCMQIADLLAISDPWWDALVRGFLRFARRSLAQRVSVLFFGNEALREVLRRHRFLERDSGVSVMVHDGRGRLGEDLLRDPARWHLTNADSDFL